MNINIRPLKVADRTCCGVNMVKMERKTRAHHIYIRLFCPICKRAYAETGEQEENWAWKKDIHGGFERVR